MLPFLFVFSVLLTRSALTDDTARISDTVVFTCDIINGTSLSWRWNDLNIVAYTAGEHDECGNRTSGPNMMEAEIYSVLAVMVPQGDSGGVNCTSLLEIKPTAEFSNVNVKCIGDDNDTVTAPVQKLLPLGARTIPPGILPSLKCQNELLFF